ncbi:hypothetical protein PISMIDRAFT_689223 [Pisolithus microcarpus 441]|uniref:Uncharacterized protein n=1 Tax=Pisolithus microcarpus 441 TaxID=765257 RepID=A0A0C9Y727_9AGAM|nr:hypothetical protein PISMIDRAFT_689223 [Pisolithus microcarpus 441]
MEYNLDSTDLVRPIIMNKNRRLVHGKFLMSRRKVAGRYTPLPGSADSLGVHLA